MHLQWYLRTGLLLWDKRNGLVSSVPVTGPEEGNPAKCNDKSLGFFLGSFAVPVAAIAVEIILL